MSFNIKSFMPFHILTLLLFTYAGFGQDPIIFDKLDHSTIPSDIKYEGVVIEAISWNEGGIDHIVVITETGVYQSDKFEHENEGLDAELFAYHYSIVDNNYQRVWKIYDYISDCPVDIEASFIRNTLQLTDLNENGIAEIWLIYKTACRGDVSPSDMKVIMYEAFQKYAMRGQNKVQLSDDEVYGGEYTFNRTFLDGPIKFRIFAKELWDKNILQVWGE